MLHSLLSLLVVAFVLLVVFVVVGKFITGAPLQIIGLIFGLILLLYGLRIFRVVLPVLLACFLFTGCTALRTDAAKVGHSLASGGEKIGASVGGWLTAHQPQIDATLGQVAAIVSRDAFNIVLSGAVSYADGSQKGDYLQGLETAFYANEGTLATADDVRKLVETWTPASTGGPEHWEVLAAAIADTWQKAHPQDSTQRAALVAQITRGLEDAVQANKGV